MKFRNKFLSAIPATDMAALFPHLKEVSLFAGEVLCEPGDPCPWIYFPSNSSIALVAVMNDLRETKIISVGYDGVVGLLPALTDAPSMNRMIVQIGGSAITLPARRLAEQAARSPACMALTLQEVQSLANQVERSAACNALHPLSARLARQLLICEDRIDGPRMGLTQDALGVMAGALRSAVSLAASEFKELGLISYSRGHLKIVDRPGLERRACECYSIDRSRWGSAEDSAAAEFSTKLADAS